MSRCSGVKIQTKDNANRWDSIDFMGSEKSFIKTIYSFRLSFKKREKSLPFVVCFLSLKICKQRRCIWLGIRIQTILVNCYCFGSDFIKFTMVQFPLVVTNYLSLRLEINCCFVWLFIKIHETLFNFMQDQLVVAQLILQLQVNRLVYRSLVTSLVRFYFGSFFPWLIVFEQFFNKYYTFSFHDF